MRPTILEASIHKMSRFTIGAAQFLLTSGSGTSAYSATDDCISFSSYAIPFIFVVSENLLLAGFRCFHTVTHNLQKKMAQEHTQKIQKINCMQQQNGFGWSKWSIVVSNTTRAAGLVRMSALITYSLRGPGPWGNISPNLRKHQ